MSNGCLHINDLGLGSMQNGCGTARAVLGLGGALPSAPHRVTSAAQVATYLYARTLGRKQYELKGHLGNVRATISDRRFRDANNDTYYPELLSTNTYYPFGMGISSLSVQGGYRFGFNGKELDNEWGLAKYDYGFRIYHPGIAKFLSVDPLTKSYPWYTPYQFAGNNPIWAIDIDGLEEMRVNELGISLKPKGKTKWERMKSQVEYTMAQNISNALSNETGIHPDIFNRVMDINLNPDYTVKIVVMSKDDIIATTRDRVQSQQKESSVKEAATNTGKSYTKNVIQEGAKQLLIKGGKVTKDIFFQASKQNPIGLILSNPLETGDSDMEMTRIMDIGSQMIDASEIIQSINNDDKVKNIVYREISKKLVELPSVVEKVEGKDN